MLINYLEKSLFQSSYSNEFSKILEYAVFPPGKMFRPKLVESISKDLNCQDDNYLYLSASIELHHAYSLVHDDLPCMDNDLIRRGKPSTHAAFGEWKAILAGDALIIKSLNELTKIQNLNTLKLIQFFTWATGPKGLICGQFLDLSSKGENSISQTLRIHELKTARLIQVATVGPHLLYSKHQSLKLFKKFLKLGKEIGIVFQLLDDLGELADKKLSQHETEINPFFNSTHYTFNKLDVSLVQLRKILKEIKLSETEKLLQGFFEDNKSFILKNHDSISHHLDEKIHSNFLKNWIKSSLGSF